MAQTGKLIRSAIFIYLSLVVLSCNQNNRSRTEVFLKPSPVFNEDSAYKFVANQVAFGPRVPQSAAHSSCGNFLVQSLSRFGFSVVEQEDSVYGYDGRLLPLRNIIGSTNPKNPKRILLGAHWDTRPYADRDDTLQTVPFSGANDGASGVGVLLEVARAISSNKSDIGIDIVFFDLEDQGMPEYEIRTANQEHFFCLGSRYWSSNLGAYSAEYGIILDMVGASGATFTMESTSRKYAEPIVKMVWDVANKLGYNDYFKYNKTPSVIDDHTYINEIAAIPCIDIIHFDASTPTRFWKAWHTHQDNMESIDRKTLKAVGQTVLQTIYNHE